jgi:hypothetical protein
MSEDDDPPLSRGDPGEGRMALPCGRCPERIREGRPGRSDAAGRPVDAEVRLAGAVRDLRGRGRGVIHGGLGGGGGREGHDHERFCVELELVHGGIGERGSVGVINKCVLRAAKRQAPERFRAPSAPPPRPRTDELAAHEVERILGERLSMEEKRSAPLPGRAGRGADGVWRTSSRNGCGKGAARLSNRCRSATGCRSTAGRCSP